MNLLGLRVQQAFSQLETPLTSSNSKRVTDVISRAASPHAMAPATGVISEVSLGIVDSMFCYEI